MKRAVLGIGNILLHDDGIGIHVINELEKEELVGVDLIDGGTAILDLLDIFINNDYIIIVDSLKGGHEPGTIYKLSAEDMDGYIKGNTSLHDVQILDIVKQAKYLGFCPQVTILGIEPEKIDYEIGLTDRLKNQLPQLIKIVKDELEEKEKCQV
ncbi:hypothetical protein Q428_14125 [Fervidicella metallireducens AeB]|uniref:Hydrogenase maturation protease n=1 Tax=Fervidicella metallireducens AeB TaxID=1403537 RepID=A0A017RRQ8_9CLOT|nr:hydrogenase maturation protease [Fervidicella metallireducens]EYE87286.1 hypothetical protein Q428_14125 [Fervidicella metallireducens AeB]